MECRSQLGECQNCVFDDLGVLILPHACCEDHHDAVVILSDEHVAAVEESLTWLYEACELPPGAPGWMQDFIGPDGGVLSFWGLYRRLRKAVVS